MLRHIELDEFRVRWTGEKTLIVAGPAMLHGDGRVEFPGSFPPEHVDEIIAAFMAFAAARAVGIQVEEDNKARRDLFTETTGLHGCYSAGSITSMSATIALHDRVVAAYPLRIGDIVEGEMEPHERWVAGLDGQLT